MKFLRGVKSIRMSWRRTGCGRMRLRNNQRFGMNRKRLGSNSGNGIDGLEKRCCLRKRNRLGVKLRTVRELGGGVLRSWRVPFILRHIIRTSNTKDVRGKLDISENCLFLQLYDF